jgi:ketosteroid isomerase-like protein
MNDDVARRERNIQVVRDVLAAFSSGDADGLLAHVADDVTYEAPYYATMPIKRGKGELADMLAAVEARFTSVFYGVVDVFPAVDPDLVIVEVRGDHQVRSDHEDTASPRRYQNHYVMFLRFRDGLVAEWREFSNPDVYRLAVDG